MKSTRQKILDTSKNMFNDYGYGQVTIRMIASELNMSSGNLNYHFKKRVDILEALYFQMVEVFDNRIEELDHQKISLQYIRLNIETSMQEMIDYRFFWTDLYHLLKSNKKIEKHFEAVKTERINGYHFVFDCLIDQAILKEPSFADEYLLLIERMINYSNTWIYASALYKNVKNSDETIKHASFQLLSMLYPYLTSLGQKDFKKGYTYFF
ncbi:TetR/AcrR family transcriptional regulator [Maribacter sp. 2210JD10-5]|uniref:TetR/AcrR family transcriptional regulator n=1 Tax=Maribacter sp. 2210JD10-5 TaxID=3386272 RepID=UPI0039BCAF67